METKFSTFLLKTAAVNVTLGVSLVTGMAIGYGTLNGIDLNPFALTSSCPVSELEVDQ